MSHTSPLEKSGLVTSEPHHLPGYCGYCPQFKFRYGKTFAQMTNWLMTDEEVASSGHSVLHDTVQDTSRREELDNSRNYLLNTRTHSLGERKFVENMVPGYCGFIPRSQNYFGTTYADVCKSGAADMALDYRKQEVNKEQMKFMEGVQAGKIQIDPNLLPSHLALSPRPLVPVAEKKELYKVSEEIQATVSPYNVQNLDPGKNLKSGFTGFVPRSRDLLGKGYPAISNVGLNRFTNETNRKTHVSTHPIHVRETLTPPLLGKAIYPADSGMIPKYNGHVPGVRFRHGQTFGHSTKDAKQVLPDVSS